jgi:hypothetical protein
VSCLPQAGDIFAQLWRAIWKEVANIAMQRARPFMAALSRHAADVIIGRF